MGNVLSAPYNQSERAQDSIDKRHKGDIHTGDNHASARLGRREPRALETLSHNGGATFKRILRKLLLWTYHEEISITEALDNNSLQKINLEIDDDDVGDDVWYTYGADIIWAEEDDGDQQYNESEDYDDDDDDDEYHDALTSGLRARSSWAHSKFGTKRETTA